MNEFPPIAEYGFLSDCEVSCLVAPDGSVEWLCLPRPDSPSVFGAMLDRRAGSFRFGPENAAVPQDRRYLPGTMVLETTWHTPTGWLVVQDLLVMGPASLDARRADFRRAPEDTVAGGILLRLATCVDGRVEVTVDCVPNFEYGTVPASFDYAGEGYGALTIRPAQGDLALSIESSLRLGVTGQRCMGRTALGQGESTFVALRWGADAIDTLEKADAAVIATVKSWRDWLSTAQIPDHPWRRYIERSALTLKGLSFAPTGAIMAAATTSLPETPGGERNWDYRYTWIRDSSFMLRSLYRLGFDWEAVNFFAFVLDAVSAGSDRNGAPALQIMYGIDGRTRPDGTHAGSPERLARLAAGADRQWCLRSAPARYVGHVARRRLDPDDAVRHAARSTGLGARGFLGRPGDGAPPRHRPGDLGSAGRAPALHRLEGHVLGGPRQGCSSGPRSG